MSANDLLFGAAPYVVVVLAVVVTITRWRQQPFTVSSLSSQMLESRKLYWGSVPFHWGITLILVGHLAALLVPQGFELWNGAPARLYLLEATGLTLGLWAGFGLCVLVYRRMTSSRIQRVTTPADMAVLALIGVQILTGVWIAVGYRWGSFWGTSVMVPYVRSLFTLSPDTALIDPMPWVIKAHVLASFAFVAALPFTRLVHMLTLPLGYLMRPWQRVVANRRTVPFDPGAR
jgi:nitrate reductase gamma subunit